MFLVVAIPVVDVRRLTRDDTGRTTVPFWPDPEFGDEFIRSLGPLRQRPLRGVTPWLGESHFVDARRGLHLNPDVHACERTDNSPELKPVFRRFYSDGVVGRLEIAFRKKPAGELEIDDTSIQDWVSRAALFPICHRNRSTRPAPIIRFGEDFAQYLLEATTSSRRRPRHLSKWWITAGAPVIVTEISVYELRHANLWLATSVEEELSRARDYRAVAVEQQWLPVGDTRISTWSVVQGEFAPSDTVRKLRVHSLRCHADLEALRSVLRLCDRARLDSNNEAVKDFLHERTRFLLRRRFDEFPQRELLERVVDGVQNGYANELSAIRGLTDSLGRGLAGKLCDLSDVLRGAPTANSARVFIYSQKGIFNMSDNSLNISGGTVGAVQAGAGNAQTIGSIDQTIGQGTDLSDLVSDLVAAVTSLRGRLPDDVADEGEDIVTVVKEEADKDQVDRGKLARWLDRIRSWADTVGDMATPVVSAVAAIAKAIS